MESKHVEGKLHESLARPEAIRPNRLRLGGTWHAMQIATEIALARPSETPKGGTGNKDKKPSRTELCVGSWDEPGREWTPRCRERHNEPIAPK